MATTDHYNLTKPEYTDAADIGDINDNMDKIDTALYGMKTKQAAVSDPTAAGTSSTFIAQIKQDTNGKIYDVLKKTVAVSNAGVTLAWGTQKTIGSVAGTNLTATLPANPVSKSTVDSALGAGSGTTFYRKDGTWATPSVSKSQVDTALGAGSGSTFYRKDGTWATPSVSKSQVDSALGAGSGSTFYRKDGSWATPSVTKSQVDSALGAGSGSTFYRKDGSWATPTDDIAIVRTFSAFESIAVSANDTKSIKAADLDYNGSSMGAPSGYKAAAVLYFTPGESHCGVDLVNGAPTDSSTTVMRVRNNSSSTRGCSPSITVLYLKSNLF